jgi:hypothetical protein
MTQQSALSRILETRMQETGRLKAELKKAHLIMERCMVAARVGYAEGVNPSGRCEAIYNKLHDYLKEYENKTGKSVIDGN